MYEKNYIEKLAEEHLSGTEIYLAGLNVSAKNHIRVFIDSDKGVSISECIALSRYIESQLDRDEHDFELEVSSWGIDQPLILRKQYRKYLTKDVKVLCTGGTTYTGQLKSITETGIELSLKLTAKQKKEKQNPEIFVQWDEISETKPVISFK